jgi:hypothetical protein
MSQTKGDSIRRHGHGPYLSQEILAGKEVPDTAKHQAPMYETAKLLYSTKKDYPKRSSPALIHEMRYIDQLGIATFEGTPAQFSTYSDPPPSRPPPCRTLWFPLSKKSAVADHRAVAELFSSLNNQVPEETLRILTDGAKQQTKNRTTCAIHIPSLEVSRLGLSWSTPVSSQQSCKPSTRP